MSEKKYKVFKLARDYGFKSAEFVELLRKIGFPVTSYQASVSEWDVPVIEERLLRGGLIQPEQATTVEAATSASEDTKSKMNLVVEIASPDPAVTPAVEVEAPTPPESEPAPEETSPEETSPREVQAEEPVQEERPQEEAPVESEEPAASPPSETAQEEAEPAPPAPATERVEEEAPVVPPSPPTPADAPSAPSGEGGTSSPPPGAEAPAAPSTESAPSSEGSEEPPPPAPPKGGEVTRRPEPAEVPSPKPRAGATKVGKIDLQALGLVKAQHNKRRGEVTFTDVRERETSRRRDQRARQRERLKSRRGAPKQVSTVARRRDVVLEAPINVRSFSIATGIAANQVLGKLMALGVMTTMNAVLDNDTVELLAAEFELNIRLKEETDIEESLMAEIEAARRASDDSDLAERPPVVAFLGHVDHGKTSLIDAIRHTKVAGGEAGGITQHIGAYTVETDSGKRITILDTPGHAAFTAMRARGAHTTDIAILVVAADDGVMPQTEEAFHHAREAGVPIIVALNKVDAPGANPERVRAELANLGLQAEEWGGTTGIVETSALRKTGIDELLERIALEAEVLDLKAHTRGQAMGVILEALVSEGKGKVVHLLVQDGRLRPGDILLASQSYGKVRRLYDTHGKVVKEAGPSMPVEMLGLNDLPAAGDHFYVVRDMKAAKEVAEKRQAHIREAELARSKVSSEDLFEHIEAAQRTKIRLVVKADVLGSLEVLRSSLTQLSNDEVEIEIVHSGVGAVTETDVQLAATAGGEVIAFNVNPDSKARRVAEKERIPIRRFNVIYELTEELERAILGLLAPETTEEIQGHAEVLQLFRSSRWGTIAGCSVLDGVLRNSSSVRVIRDGKVLVTSKLDSLRHVKDDVREVKAGMECGLKVADFDDIQPGDQIEAFRLVEKERSLESLGGDDPDEG